jgi:serine phosphatase RsbU (regulator of sigma subunit)
MKATIEAFEHEYEDAFNRHLASADEAGLSDAYELGRSAMLRGLSFLDIAAIHHEVLSHTLQARGGVDQATAAAASAFFLEVLSTYEMVQRGAAEAHQTARLKQLHAAQLRRLAEASVAINGAGSPEEIARLLPEHAVSVIGAAHASVEVAPAAGPRVVHHHPAGDERALRGARLEVPLLRRNESLLGTLAINAAPGGSFSDNDQALLTQLAQLAGVALENAELYESQRIVAETLQRTLLPRTLPRLPGVDMAVRYLPGAREGDVGGDWYDAVALPDESLALMVGDVMGKGIRAAAGMGQLRVALRAYAIEGHPPAQVLERLDQVLEELQGDLATVVYLVYDPSQLSLRYSNAGHPPPLLILPDGSTRLLRGGLAPPLGCMIGTGCTEAQVEVPAGSTLVIYTDGLVERRGADIEDGLKRMAAVAAGAKAEALEAFCDELLDGMDAEHRGDDVALLVVRFAG